MTWSGKRPAGTPPRGRFDLRVYSTKSDVIVGMSCSATGVCGFCLLISTSIICVLYFAVFYHNLLSPQLPNHDAVRSTR